LASDADSSGFAPDPAGPVSDVVERRRGMLTSVIVHLAAAATSQAGYPPGGPYDVNGYPAPIPANPAPAYAPAYPAYPPSGMPGPTPLPGAYPPGPYAQAPAMAGGQPVGTPAPSETPGYPALSDAYQQYAFGGQAEQKWPFDTQQNWVHGYFQEIPAYGGHHVFRPYNYKDILSQSQTAAGWGLSPSMPYSQQFWHRYQDRAAMMKLSETAPATRPAVPVDHFGVPARVYPETQVQWVTEGVIPTSEFRPVEQPVQPLMPASSGPAAGPYLPLLTGPGR
jgi:hypothetical protein